MKTNEGPMRPLNLNVAIIGHVDSGKTSLSHMLSTVPSTASFDRSVESVSRGMTLDLGFSSFTVDSVDSVGSVGSVGSGQPRPSQCQYTIVDCPGHTSLIRQVMSAKGIVDGVVIVVSGVEGVQAQTVECAVIGDAVLDEKKRLPSSGSAARGLVVVSKVDSIQGGEGGERYLQVVQEVRELLAGTNFQGCEIVPCSTKIGGCHRSNVIEAIGRSIGRPDRTILKGEQFYFMIDHCFAMKGQGTVLTGTVITGKLSVNESVYFPALSKTCKVKNIQSFHKTVAFIAKGDRAGICVAGLDSKLLERGVAVGSDKALRNVKQAIAKVKRVSMYQQRLKSGEKFHCTIGNSTVMATLTFFGAKELAEGDQEPGKREAGGFDVFERDYAAQDFYLDAYPPPDFDEPAGGSSAATSPILPQYALVKLETSVYCPADATLICSRLDTNYNCRLALTGTLTATADGKERPTIESRLNFYTMKEKTCKVDKLGEKFIRSSDGKEVVFDVIAKNLFGDGAVMANFTGLKMLTKDGQVGFISGAFGTDGKFRLVN